jgi:hypothetical protein
MEAELAREGLAFATVGMYNCDVMPKTAPDASPSGFTEFDLATLDEYRAIQVAKRHWGRTQLVRGPFADFLAAWPPEAANAEVPHLTIARFKRTGTYALTIGASVVATASTLDRILPASSQTNRETVSAV